MKVDFVQGSDWGPPQLRCEDEHGNQGTVRFPWFRERLSRPGIWIDAEVHMHTGTDGTPEETIHAAEFAIELARITNVLNDAYAGEAQAHKDREDKERAERLIQERVSRLALQARCQEVAQFYMQLVRVQRQGQSSTAKGELLIRMQSDNESINRRMFLKESNGNQWDFEADRIDKFEVKDGNRYNSVELTPMEDLERKIRDDQG